MFCLLVTHFLIQYQCTKIKISFSFVIKKYFHSQNQGSVRTSKEATKNQLSGQQGYKDLKVIADW